MNDTITIQFDIADDLAAYRRGLEAISGLTEAEAVALARKLEREFMGALQRSARAEEAASKARSECEIGRP